MGLARTTVEDIFTAAQIPLDKTTRGTAYNQGRVWVLLDGHTKSNAGRGEALAVVAAVAEGHHDRLDELVDEIYAAIRNDGQCNIVGFEATYGQPTPVPGRKFPSPADVAVIAVSTPFDR